MVGVGEESGEDLLRASEQAPLVGGQIIPPCTQRGGSVQGVPGGTTPRSSWRAKAASRHAPNPGRNDPRNGRSTPVGPDGGRAERPWPSTGRTAYPGSRAAGRQKTDGFVDQVLSQVIAVLGALGGSTKWLSETRFGVHWLVSACRNP